MYRLRLFSTVRTVVVDYSNDPKADTGLFVKVVPEKLTSTTETTNPADSSAKTEKAAAATHHYQKTDKVNDELPTTRTVMVQEAKAEAGTPAGKIFATVVVARFRNN